MRFRMLALALLAACDKSPSSTRLDSPAAAARCQVAAIEVKDVDRWIACCHPAFRDHAKAELARDAAEPGFWARAKTRAAPLANVTDAQFTREPVPDGKTDLGDQVASFRLENDSFEVVRKDGRWYVVDSGI